MNPIADGTLAAMSDDRNGAARETASKIFVAVIVVIVVIARIAALQ